MGTLIGEAEHRYIISGAEQNCRNDGRQRQDIRRADVELGVIPNATGSARVRLGGTDVIVAVKAEIGTPSQERPDAGILKFHVECSPVASPAFRGRGGEELGSEIARALERSMYVPPGPSASSSTLTPLDLTALKIVSGKTCWVLFIDALILDLDGAAIDATSIAMKSALFDSRIPKVDIVQSDDPGDEPEYELDDDPEQAIRLDISRVPLLLSIGLLGTSAAIVDPTAEEEESARAVLQIAVDAEGMVAGVTKRRESGIEPVMLMEMIGLAQRQGKVMHNALDVFLKESEEDSD
jgi:exosome complex component RRP42